MSKYVDKRALLVTQILKHIAQEGFSSVYHFSRLAKEIKVGRSLLYFYFKNTDEILEEVGSLFKSLLTEHHRFILDRQLDFKQYVHSLLNIRELVFFINECQKEQQRIPSVQAHIELVMKTLDDYSFQRFKEYYQIDEQSLDVEFLYACCRSQWWESIGTYASWNEASIDTFLRSLDKLMEQYTSQPESAP